MKRLLLFALLSQTSLYADNFTQKDLRAYNIKLNNATTASAVKSILTQFYVLYGDPNDYPLGDNFIKYALQQWQTVSTQPFFSYTMYIQSIKPSSGSAPVSQPVTSPVTVPTQPVQPTRNTPTTTLSPTDFVAQLTDQVNKSLTLLKTTLQDPILSQEVTDDQRSLIQSTLDEVTPLLHQE